MLEKNHDYGRDNITESGLLGLGVRLKDKVNRIINLAGRPGMTAAVQDEDIRKTCLDVANYGTIGMMLVDGTWQGALPPEGTDSAFLSVYLGGPIDKITMNQASDWRKLAKATLATADVTCFDPTGAFGTPNIFDSIRADFIVAVNRAAIYMSNICLFHFPTQELGFGTAREIEFATGLGKRVIVSLPYGGIHSLEAQDFESYSTLGNSLEAIIDTAIEKSGIDYRAIESLFLRRKHP